MSVRLEHASLIVLKLRICVFFGEMATRSVSFEVAHIRFSSNIWKPEASAREEARAVFPSLTRRVTKMRNFKAYASGYENAQPHSLIVRDIDETIRFLKAGFASPAAGRCEWSGKVGMIPTLAASAAVGMVWFFVSGS